MQTCQIGRLPTFPALLVRSCTVAGFIWLLTCGNFWWLTRNSFFSNLLKYWLMDHLVFHEAHLSFREEIVVEHQKWGSRQNFLSSIFEHSVKGIHKESFTWVNESTINSCKEWEQIKKVEKSFTWAGLKWNRDVLLLPGDTSALL